MQVIAPEQRWSGDQGQRGNGRVGSGADEVGSGFRAAVTVVVAQIFQAQALSVLQGAHGAEQGDAVPRGFSLKAERQQLIGG